MLLRNNNLSRRKFLRKSLMAGVYLIGRNGLVDPSRKVALIGDFIRLEYQPKVSGFLGDKAILWGPEEDAGNTVNVLEHIKDWITADQYDIIHINSGLNDLRTIDYVGNEPMIPLEFYARNVESIIKLINKYSPGSVVVWATTTPVIDNLFINFHENLQDFQMKNEDVIRYNTAAINIVTRLGTAVNDIYSYIMEGDASSIVDFDGVHYTDYGYELIGERISNVISKIINSL